MTFKELRKQKNELQNKLEFEQYKVRELSKFLNQECGLTERLNRQIQALTSKLELESKAKNRVKLRLVGAEWSRDRNYKNFISEATERSKLMQYLITVCVFGGAAIIGLVITLVNKG